MWCTLNVIEAEFHFMIKYLQYRVMRQKYFTNALFLPIEKLMLLSSKSAEMLRAIYISMFIVLRQDIFLYMYLVNF